MGSKNQKSSSGQTQASNSTSNAQTDTSGTSLSTSQADALTKSLGASDTTSAGASAANSASNTAANSSLSTMASDPALLAAYHSLLSGAQATTSNPLQLYNGQLVADLTPDQRAAISQISGAGGLATPYLTDAASLVRSSATPFSQDSLSQYYSPYQSDVINSTRDLLNQQDKEQQTGLAGNITAAGAWGGAGKPGLFHRAGSV